MNRNQPVEVETERLKRKVDINSSVEAQSLPSFLLSGRGGGEGRGGGGGRGGRGGGGGGRGGGGGQQRHV